MVHDLRAYYPDGARVIDTGGGRLDEPHDGVGVQLNVVSKEAEVVGPGSDRQRERRRDGAGGPEGLRQSKDPPLTERLNQDLVRAVGRGVVHSYDPEPRVGLSRESGKACTEPLGCLTNDEDD
jgi:hypothetical protein